MYYVINNVLIGLNNLGRVFCNYAAGVFVQSAMLVILLLVVDLLLRKRVRAVFRYCIWLLVLVKLVLPPSLSLPTGIGYWFGDHLPAAIPISDRAFDVAGLERASPSGEMPQVRPTRDFPENDSSIMLADSALTPLAWQAVLFILWLVGVFAFLVVLFQRVRFVRGLIAVSSPAKKELLGLLEQCRRKIGVRWDIRLRISDTIPSPAVCGFFRPIVLIPATLVEKLSLEGLRATLIHELAHIKRGDLWVNSVQTFLQVVYFYNPFVWFANAVIRRVCEEAVDETVLVTLGGQAKNYSNTLIDIGEMAFWRADLGLRLIGVAESKKALQWRIRHMLNRPIPKSSRLGVFGIATLLVIGAILLPMAKAQKPDEGNKPVTSINHEEPPKSLNQAASIGDVERVKALISAGAGVNDPQRDRWNRTLLHLAAKRGQNEVVEFLLASGADINVKSRWAHTPLHFAANASHRDTAELLISAGADIRARDDFGLTPLGAAIMTVNPALTATVLTEPGRRQDATGTAAMLIAKGAIVSPIHWAAFVGDAKRVRELLDQGVDVNTKDPAFDAATPLHLATLGEREDVIRLLVSKGADINAKTGSMGSTALHMATSVNVAKVLIDEGAEVNVRSKWAEYAPLHLAVISGRMEMIKLLIAKGADVNGRRPTPLGAIGIGAGQSLADKPEGSSDLATLRGILESRVAVAKVLITAGADCSALSSSILHQATNADARDMVNLMLAHGADANGKVAGRTPLHVMAGQLNNRDMVELLLAHGAEVNAKDNVGATPLWHANVRGNTAIADILTMHGAIEQSPPLSLYQAARDGDLELLKSLIAKGGDVNAQSDRWGGTPLHLAATSTRRRVIEFLIANGADVNAQNRYGRTPLDDVMDRDQAEIAELLRQAGAKSGTPVAPPTSTSGPSFFERAPSRFAIPKENLRIPDDEESCAANLRKIYTAIKQYEKEKGGLPYWLSDLVPDYLAQKTLLCPANPEHTAVFMYFGPHIPMEPRLPCSYVYEFSMARLPTPAPGSPTGCMITRDRKTAQMRLFGDVVPLVRCRAQRVILNVAVNGQVYVSPIVWEKVFMPKYRAGQELAEETSP